MVKKYWPINFYSKVVENASPNYLKHLEAFHFTEYVRIISSNNFGDSQVLANINAETLNRLNNVEFNTFDKNILFNSLVHLDRITPELLSEFEIHFENV